MVSLASLWMPILLSAMVVFVASSIIHMALSYHKTDFRRMPDEAAAHAALRSLNLAPGDYMYPFAGSSAERKDPEFIRRQTEGPISILTVLPSGPPSMGALLGKWFVYTVVVSVFSGYVAGIVLAPGTLYLTVFRVAGTVAFTGYALAHWQGAIWYGKSGATTLRQTLDGLIYGALTGGVFGWLWPV